MAKTPQRGSCLDLIFAVYPPRLVQPAKFLLPKTLFYILLQKKNRFPHLPGEGL